MQGCWTSGPHWIHTGSIQDNFREEPVFDPIVGLGPTPRIHELGARYRGACLEADGSALIKAFKEPDFSRTHERVAATRRQFAKVKLCKPEASRTRSPELYLLAKGYRLV